LPQQLANQEAPSVVQPPENLNQFESLLKVVEALRGPEGCPWDKEQTHRTLTPYAIEEAHELAEAIELGDEKEMVSELGDLLLQVVLHAEIGRQEKRFTINDVIRAIAEKMVSRHPHVFGNEKVENSEAVLKNWSELKAKEKQASGKVDKSNMRFDVAVTMPALARSQKIGEKTKRLRFDWSTPEQVLEKVDEELAELKAEMQERDPAKLEHEIGDLLFSTAQLARHLGLEAEQCLRTANARFETRFFTMRKRIEASGRDYDSLSLEELEQAWQATKASLKAGR
jgi:tetrapyrrole methylase family protein/MazG family protein